MRKRWIGYLLALFTLLWAKLPGPSAQEEPDPSREIRCKHIGMTEKGVTVEISTEAARLPCLSERITRITMQKVQPQLGGRYAAKEAPLKSSNIKVVVTSPRTVELHDLRPEVGERLTSGTGHYAIVTGIEEKRRFDKREDMLVMGKGQGIWRILRRK
jgi:hypothetical protein